MREMYKEGGESYAVRRRDRRAVDVKGDKYHLRKLYRRRRLILTGVAVACVLLVLAAVANLLLAGEGEIRRGVYIGSAEVSGQTQGEARETVESRASEAFEEISFSGASDEFSVSGEELGVSVDSAASAQEAYLIGRSGGPLQRVSDLLGSQTRVDAEVGYDEEAARDALGEMGTVEQEETLANLDRALADLNGEVPLAESVPAAELAASSEAAPVEEAGASEPTVLLGEFFTDHAWDPDEGRQANLKIASQAIDETVIAPGEEFSALSVLAPLDYEPAKVFANGGVDYEIGGGLCQVSSTLYMAAHYAGLEITERNPHYAELPYIRPGFDATVWFGGAGIEPLDMKFKNTTDGNILIREFVNEDGFLVAEIYGEEPGNKVVSMDSEKIKEDLQKGIEWATYKKVIEDGEVVEDGTLFKTTYSYNPPVPEELKHETSEPRGSGWLDQSNTTNWNDKD
jgi:vancomycin resistance protein YoaR